MTTPPPPNRWRIMAVDDDRDILELIRMTLIDEYEIVTFHEPMSAFQQLDIVEPDLVVLDIMMPRLTGYQIVEMMKANRKYADVPVVFLSAKDANRDIKYGYKLGASIYLTKPFQPDRLLRNIDSLFQRTPPRRKPRRHKYEELLTVLKMSEEYGISRTVATANPEAAKPGVKPGLATEEAESSGPDWVN